MRQQLDDLRSRGLLPTTAASEVVIPGLPLEKSHRGPMVTSAQKKLNALLALKGKARLSTDGQFGKGTVNAVKAFQASVNLPATGVIDRTTWNTMGFADRIDLAVLKVGSVHPSVATIQRSLAKVLKKRISPTGRFTSSLSNDVKTFQKRAGLKQSGRVGPQTWNLLMAAVARA